MGANILVVVGIILLLFGGRKLPQLMGIGKGTNEFNQAENDLHKDGKNNAE
jgi:sec-independent protein translocase protein TatA